MESHDLKALFSRMLQALVVEKPSEPLSFLAEFLRRPQSNMKILIAGAPAAGKGTQCEMLVAKYGLVHVSTGDLLREEVKKRSEIGKRAQEYMDKGILVPDSLIIDLVKQRLLQADCVEKGWLLDGFPRTRSQALAMQSAGVLPDKFVLLNVDDGTVVDRMSGRRIDPESGKIYHVKYAPATDARVAARLVQRADDTEEAIRQRLAVYHHNMAQVVECYKHLVQPIDASKPKEEIFLDIVAYLESSDSRPLGYAKGPKIVISGAPASGKGTQCEKIVQAFNVVHISTGDLLRDHVKRGTDLGRRAKEFMDSGKLVPDQLIVDLVRDRLSKEDCKERGWLLDGFPRTRKQALALSGMGVLPDKFIQLDVPDYLLVERVTGRRTDPVSGKIYHLKFSPPTDPDVAGRLVQRADDTEDTVRNRLQEFHRNAKEVLENYASLVRRFDGAVKPDEIFAEINKYLQQQP